MQESLSIEAMRKTRQIQWLKKLKRLQKVEDNFKQFPLLPVYKPRLRDPGALWLTFFRQKQAFQYVDSHQDDVHVFAFEVDNNHSDHKGQRKFCVTSYSQMWHVIKHAAKRCCYISFYEVIPKGATCKLYFDLEYNKELNLEHDGKRMVQTLIKLVCDELKSLFQVEANKKRTLILDASTEKKFSCHLIFNIPDFAFKDNQHQGHFVNGVCCKIRKLIQINNKRNEWNSDDDNIEEPVIKKPKQENFDEYDNITELLVQDSDGVYTKNRNFRLYKCTKLSKNNPLLIADYNEYKPTISNGHNEEHQIFLDSIISNVNYSSKMRICTSEGFHRHKNTSLEEDTNNVTTGSNKDVQEGYQKSPYPSLDEYIMSKVNKGGIQGEIRRWTYYAQGGIFVYNIAKNRWCENIGRQHKSNNISMIVDLKKAVYYQKCLDPDCRAIDYKSPDQAIPLHVLPAYDDLDDDELLEAAEKYEASHKEVTNDGGINDFLNDDENDDFIEAIDVLEKSFEEGIANP